MVNGKAQIYFDAFEHAAPAKSKAKRNSRATVNPPPAPPSAPKPKPVRTTKPTKVTFKQDESKVGVFMTMEDIAELVRTVKEGAPPPPPPPTITKVTTVEQPPPVPEPQPVVVVEPPREFVQQILAPISPRQEALGMMADKKRLKWMREKGQWSRSGFRDDRILIFSGNGSNEVGSRI